MADERVAAILREDNNVVSTALANEAKLRARAETAEARIELLTGALEAVLDWAVKMPGYHIQPDVQAAHVVLRRPLQRGELVHPADCECDGTGQIEMSDPLDSTAPSWFEPCPFQAAEKGQNVD